MLQNFTCPHCSDGFIEELQEPLDSNSDNAEVDDWEDDGVSTLIYTDLLDYKATSVLDG